MNQAHPDIGDWLWAIVVTRGPHEDLFNYEHPQRGEHLVPAFENKEAAQGFWDRLTARPEGQGEVQAFHKPNLVAAARQNGLAVVVLGPDGGLVARLE
ncbi:MAG: hypothetical protein KJ621_08265 [Proteobacteria bacterium]|nr:hypothetical protein [Pseudomonadota bacterium]MBU1741343.1 hypothetical protein [Pseudomonadota bacterium]